MKKIIILFAGVFMLAGCFKDERNNFMVSDSLGITSLENVVEASVHTGGYMLGIAKSGKGQTAAQMHIVCDENRCKPLLDEYNNNNKTHFEPIQLSLISLDRTSVSFTEQDASQTVSLSWDPEKVAQYMGDKDQYVIPLFIESDTEDVKVNGERSFILIHLNRSCVTVNQKAISRVVEKKTVEPDKNGKQPVLQESVVLDVVIDKPIKGVGITYPVVVDNSLIEDFSASKGKEYIAVPKGLEGLVTVVTPSVAIPEGGKSCTIQVKLDYSVLLKDGQLPEFPSYVVPLRLDTGAAQSTLNGKDFSLQGLSYDNLVTYVSFDWKQSKVGFDVTREWGLYSTTTASWSDYIPGFTANTDRNVTLDGENIYITETNATKNLWAISLKDPGTYKKLPVGSVIENGTFHLSCPRVIPNSNPDINGGKPVLAVSSMHTGGDPVIYFYNNGIGEDPKMVKLTTWASRRLGDTFSWWGTLQNGVLLFKDFNSAQGTVTFWLRGNLSEQFYLIGRVQAPPVTGAGAYFPFPESTESGFASTRGGAVSWLVQTKNLNTLEGADNSPTLTELAEEWADCSFRYFTLAGKRYIAVAKQDSSQTGRLIIMEGEDGTPWPDILSGGKMVYTAAIQNDTENDDLDNTADKEARASGNSGMDLDIYQNDTDVYIAVIKQNVGLSLFHVSNDE